MVLAPPFAGKDFMRVRMLTTVAGTDKKGNIYCHPAGEELELPASLAKEYCSVPEDFPRAEPIAVKRQQRAETR